MINPFRKPPFCEDCKWAKQLEHGHWQCYCAEAVYGPSVTKEVKDRYGSDCGYVREGRCGKRGKYFEAKT